MRSGELPAEAVLEALYNDFGLLIERAPGIYSFSHLTLHEHLVARFIVDHRSELELVELYGRHASWFAVVTLVSRILPKADAFLRALWARIAIADSHDIALWLAVWEMEPICEPRTVLELMGALAGDLRSSLDCLDCLYLINESVLCGIPQSPSGLKRGVYDQEGGVVGVSPLFCSQVLCSIPDILKIFEVCGTSWRDLGLGDLDLFKALEQSKVGAIEGVEIVKSVSLETVAGSASSGGNSVLKRLTKG